MYAISSVNEGKYRVLSTTLVDAFQQDREGGAELIPIGEEPRSPLPASEDPYAASMEPAAGVDETDLTEPEAEELAPLLPPLDIGKYTGRKQTRQTAPHIVLPTDAAAGLTDTAAGMNTEPLPDDGTSVVDFYAVVLGLLALGAVLGLIPLWISVFSAFAR